ncbi:MAG: hypothetical protein K0R66_1410 [Gammaproteobacteria bacterium]|jgi:hypothetical protein|nr:hypothetical protein [Gammaproteobacteria bacterium]
MYANFTRLEPVSPSAGSPARSTKPVDLFEPPFVFFLNPPQEEDRKVGSKQARQDGADRNPHAPKSLRPD